MTQLRKFIKIFIILASIAIHGNCQNLYDLEHSKQYAEFLFQSQQYKLASMEFERLVFMEPHSSIFQQKLLKSYRKSDQVSQGLIRIKEWYPKNIPDTALYREYAKLSLLDNRFNDLLSSLNSPAPIALSEKNYYQLSAILLKRNWAGAENFITNSINSTWPGFTDLCDLHKQQADITYRKPGLALAMSAVVPGLGKIYSKDWKDGLISFLFVATNAFQAYRGFSKNGINSAYGWIFGGMSLGFYAGNLFGSWKSAKDYNFRSEDAIYHEIQNTIYSRF